MGRQLRTLRGFLGDLTVTEAAAHWTRYWILSHIRDADDYMRHVRWNPRDMLDDIMRPRCNVPPGTGPIVLRRPGDGA